MIRTAAVFAAVKLLWDRSAVLSSRVPGGFWEGRPKAEAAWPYASAKLEPQPIIWTSGPSLYPFDLTVSVWSKEGGTDAGRLDAAMHETFKRSNRVFLVVAGATKTVDLYPLEASGLDTEDGQQEGSDVKLTAGKWRILIEAAN